jgi:hypothetical protein
VWNWKPADAPDHKFSGLQQAWRMPNGNTVINNWMNEWNYGDRENHPQDAQGSIQAIELAPAKEVVWALREWTAPTGLAQGGLGPATSI